MNDLKQQLQDAMERVACHGGREVIDISPKADEPKPRTFRIHVPSKDRVLPNGLSNPGYCIPAATSSIPENLLARVMTGRGFVTRNSKCPCGSGLRFKRCCMKKEGA